MNHDAPGASEHRAAWARLVSNSNWNFAAFAIVVLANFLTLPYVIHRIGIAQFGLGGLILAMLAPFMFVGTVIGQACVREISPMLAEHRTEAARQTFSSALALCVCGCAAVLVAFGIGGSYLVQRFMGTATGATQSLQAACLVATVGWAAQQIFQVFQSTIISTQQFRALATLNVVAAIASSLCLLAATWIAPTLFGFLSGAAAGFMVTLLLTLGQARRHAAAMFPLAHPRLADVRRIVAFCRWQVPAQLAGSIALQTDRYLLGATATMSVVGQFNVATRLQEVVYMGVLKISEVLFPHFSAAADKPVQQKISVFMASSWLVNTIAAAALAPLIPLSAALVALWVGADATEFGAPILCTLVTAGIVGSGMNVFSYFAMGNGYSKQLGVMALAHSAAVALCSTALILNFGAMVAGAGFLAANVLRLVWATSLTPSMIGNRLRMREVAQSTLPPLGSGLLVGWCLWPVSASSWLALAGNYALIAAAVLLASLVLSAIFPAARALMLGIYAGARDHLVKR